jgi:hypothetical protein
MYFTDEKLIIETLQEALVLYITRLKQIQEEWQQALPHHGKKPESPADIELESHIQERLVTAEKCLGFKDKIAQNIKAWTNNWNDDHLAWKESRASELTVYNVNEVKQSCADIFPVLYSETPFIDLMGKWHEDITTFSAGPSGQKHEPITLGLDGEEQAQKTARGGSPESRPSRSLEASTPSMAMTQQAMSSPQTSPDVSVIKSSPVCYVFVSIFTMLTKSFR